MNRKLKLQYWMSLLWSSVNRMRRKARDTHRSTSARLPVRTIGIGNLQAGGAGKTPLTIRIAREAVAKGLQVAVLTRGYRSKWEKTGGTVSPDESMPSPVTSGDEPALIRAEVPQVWMGIGANRLRQFQILEERLKKLTGKPFDLVLLDDAFQHWAIHCDQYVLAVTDAEYGARLFRDDFRSIHSSDLVVLTKGNALPAALRAHPLQVHAKFRLTNAVDPGKSYRFFAALGDPHHALQSLLQAGFRISNHVYFPDHHRFTEKEIVKLLAVADAAGEHALLTGKDWVKWKSLGIPESRVTVVEPELQIVRGEEIWNRFFWKELGVGRTHPSIR